MPRRAGTRKSYVTAIKDPCRQRAVTNCRRLPARPRRGSGDEEMLSVGGRWAADMVKDSPEERASGRFVDHARRCSPRGRSV